MFKQNIYANEGKFETSAQPNIINSASIVQTDLYRLQQPLHPVVNIMSKNYVSHLKKIGIVDSISYIVGASTRE